ncbi:MAG: deoxyribose-phosphate aldolase [Candidatus Atribacteria bacterium]|nr:deoxyribose-phosphate aldolase [Candidatus Atribacteria bacterium]
MDRLEIEKWKQKVEDELGVEIKEKERFPLQEEIPAQEEKLVGFLAQCIDHTLLRAYATREEIEKLCQEAKEWNFRGVIVNPFYVSLCHRLLEGANPIVEVVVGFPLGQSKPEVKAREAREAFQDGAKEADMVINIGALKDSEWRLVYEDILGVVEEMFPGLVKVILENCYLTEEEKVVGCLISQAAGAQFVKTSTGFGIGGATGEDVKLMRQVVGGSMGIKAAGGIRSREDVLRMIQAGANRIGTSSGVSIVSGN